MLIKGATISPCGKFRYRLWRQWAPGRCLVFVMLNPSTADGTQDDPTIRKCIGFAQRNGYQGVEVVNLFAYRATDPRDLAAAGYPVGPDNDTEIVGVLARAKRNGAHVVLAWGVGARGHARADELVAKMRFALVPLHVLGLTSDGIPRHPLMLAYSSKLEPYPQ